MEEQIDMDRKALKEGKIKQGNAGFSYIPYLIPKKERKPRKMVSISNLSTLNIICYLDESIKLTDKYILSNIDVFKRELLQRTDLFCSAIKFINQSTIKSSLYYWNPGISPDNIFEFICELIPDFVQKYKEYYIQSLVTGTSYLDCLMFIKEHCSSEYYQFEMIARDVALFENGVSGAFWVDNPSEYSGTFPEIPARVDFGEDVEGILLPEVSYVECLIGERLFIVPLSRLEGLIMNRETDREFWEKNGIINTEWEVVIKNDQK